MRKVILYIAVTLDGYIADEHDEFSFLAEYDSLVEVQQSYEALMKRVDTLFLGRVTYDAIKGVTPWPYEGMTTYVVSHQQFSSEHPIIVTDQPLKVIEQLKQQPGKDIWLVGGGQLISTFLTNDLIDEYQIAVIPKLIGKGKRLFPPQELSLKLKLVSSQPMGEIVMLTYIKNRID